MDIYNKYYILFTDQHSDQGEKQEFPHIMEGDPTQTSTEVRILPQWKF